MKPARIAIILVALAIGVVGMLSSATAPGPAASRPASAPAASRSVATAPAPAASRPASRPGESLAEACRKRAEEVRAALDETFEIVAVPPFVLAGNMPRQAVEDYAAQSVLRPAQAMWKSYFRERPHEPITILLFADEDGYRRWARKLYGDTDVPHYGYYKHARRTLVMNISTGSGTLVHELTHALIAFDFPDVPAWFNEGLASLHEQCSVLDDRIVGMVNWRLPDLQRAIAASALRPLRELITADDFYGRRLGLNYAQARYLCMYLQHKGVLGDFYALYRAAHKGPDAAAEAIEKVLGSGIDQVEKDLNAYVMTLRWPVR